MNFDRITEATAKLTALRYFPADVLARLAIAELIAGMCRTEDQAEWLVRRIIQCYNEWPGPLEIRACFCARYKPADGIEAYSAIYLGGGFPADPELNKQLTSGSEVKQLPEPERGESVSGALSIAQAVSDLCELKDLNRIVKGIPARGVREIPTVQITEANRITEAQMKEAEREYRRKRDAAQLAEIKAGA